MTSHQQVAYVPYWHAGQSQYKCGKCYRGNIRPGCKTRQKCKVCRTWNVPTADCAYWKYREGMMLGDIAP